MNIKKSLIPTIGSDIKFPSLKTLIFLTLYIHDD